MDLVPAQPLYIHKMPSMHTAPMMQIHLLEAAVTWSTGVLELPNPNLCVHQEAQMAFQNQADPS